MKVKDLFDIEDIDIDVCDDYDERCFIAFCGGYALTDEGKERFKVALDIPINHIQNIIGLHCENSKEAQACKDLFESVAGYCSEKDFDKWFVSV